MTTTTKITVTLADFWNANTVTEIFVVGIGCPAGQSYRHNTDTEDDEEYCDLGELLNGGLFGIDEQGESGCWDLTGTVKDGVWTWNGEGNPRDWRGNSYTKIELYSEGE